MLQGGVSFFSGLLRSVEPAFCRGHAYRKGMNADAAAELAVDFPDSVAGRAVLLVDNICDSERTLAELTRLCCDRGAAEARAAVLIHRRHDDAQFTPHHAAFHHHGPGWLAGFGMRDGDAAMNFPAVFSVRPCSSS